MHFVIRQGFEERHRDKAVQMFWRAFSGKLHPVMKPERKALEFFRLVLNPDFAISAVSDENALIGMAGFKTADGAFAGGGLREMATVYGWTGGTFRGIVLSLLERPLEAGILLMDGIFVDAPVRGQGVGTALLAAIKQKAADLGCNKVRLDVIDRNPGARALYERQGFVAGETSPTGPLKHVFGFRSSTAMTFNPKNND